MKKKIFIITLLLPKLLAVKKKFIYIRNMVK